MNIKLLGTLLLALGTLTTSAQTISSDTITWVATKAINQADHSEFDYNGTFVTYGKTVLDWSQRGGRSVNHYTITSTDGAWSNIDADGQRIFYVKSGVVTGTVSFARSGGSITVHLRLLVNDKPDQDYIFYITSTSPVH